MNKIATSLFCVTALLAAAWTAHAEDGKSAPQLLNVNSVYDESQYAWPGENPDKRPIASGFTAIGGAAVSPIVPYGQCVYVDGVGAATLQSYKFTTVEDWQAFKDKNKEVLDFAPCCRTSVIDNPKGAGNRKIMAARVGEVRTIAFSGMEVYLYRCVPVTSGNPTWTMVGGISGAPMAPAAARE